MKILVANSLARKNKPLVALLRSLAGHFDLVVRSSDVFFFSSFPGGKKMNFGPSAGGWGDLLFFPWVLISWPFYFIWLLIAVFRGRLKSLICVGANEKVILTLPARLFRLRVFWLEMPDAAYSRFSVSTWLLSWLSRLAVAVCFTSSSLSERVSLGFGRDNVAVLPPAPEADYARQDDIFSKLAVSDKPKVFFKKFSIGTVVDFSDCGHFETLLKAVKNCSNVIPNIQLVVIGSSSQRRNINWLSKRLGIESRVWFVGEQGDLVRWFDDLDLYFSLSDRPNLFDLETALLAMSRGVPAVVFDGERFSDFIADGQTGFVVGSGTEETLTKRLIDIESDKSLLKKVGDGGRLLVEQRLNRRNQVEMLTNLFKSMI